MLCHVENIVQLYKLLIRYSTAKIWNTIPLELREKPKNRFKKSLHRKLFQIFEKRDDYIDIETTKKKL